MNKLVCMGEAVIDFIPEQPGALTYTAKAGGAPANVCACVAKLGAPAYYFGKLSADNFGKFLKAEMEKYDVDTSMTVVDDGVKTGLVFVDLYPSGDREFFFYRDNPADARLYPEDVPDDLLQKGDILHFCSVALMECPTKHAHEKAILQARERGALVSFDINERLHLWRDVNRLRDTCYEFIPLSDIIKVTDDELTMLTENNIELDAVKELFAAAENAKLIFVTKGKKGSSVYDRSLCGLHFSALGDKVIDTTGAGDCFIGSIIYKLLNKEADLTLSGIRDAVKFANSACSIVISKKGAMNAMPALDEVNTVL